MLILIDKDKTLVDQQYLLTDAGIGETIRACTAKGYQIGLSSDSAVASLRSLHAELGMNGPILAERGAVAAIGTDLGLPMPTGSVPDRRFLDLRAILLDWFSTYGIDAIVGDPADLVRDRTYRTARARQVAFVNAHRLCSLAIMVRIVDGDAYAFDQDLLNILTDFVRGLTSERSTPFHGFQYDFDANPEYGILIVHCTDSTKGFGTRFLLDQLGINRCVVIGDSLGDFTGLPAVEHWAVGNASDAYRQRCTRTAVATYTGGVIELLTSLP